MKAGWKTVKLGEACKIVNGATPSTSLEANWGGPHCWITPAEMGGLSDPYVSKTRRTLTDAGLADCSASLLPTGSVILSSRAPIGHVIINTVPMATNQGCKSMIPRSDLDAKFLFYFIKANVPLLESLGTGATFKELSGGKLASVEIPLPPLIEQKQIVALLDEAFAGIDEAKANAEANLHDAEESFNSLIDTKIDSASQGAPCTPLEELCDDNRVITYGVIKLGEPVSEGVYCLRCGNLKRLKIDLEGVRKIPHSLSKEYSRTVLKGGELLVNVRGTLGGVCVAPNTMSGWNVAREIAVIPLRSDAAAAEYLSYHVATSASQSWLMGRRKGAAYVGINIEDIRRLPIYLPPRKEQERVSSLLSEAHGHTVKLQDIYEKKVQKLLDLKSSLLTQAFAGDLTA